MNMITGQVRLFEAKAVSGLDIETVRFLLWAETSFSTTSGTHGDSFQIISCASL
ncbi:Uncharacterised protein [Klebsiella pneumoniae]|uniref:Uncharacterized protein n=1 Tax=Klebsiella pneumoniae TaxID=573 RepID=A0A4P0Y225_KLEPN|nr:Uncharacterised protein [Klebsiella pneumoniae]